MKYIGQHIFDYVASFRQKVGIGTDTPAQPLHVSGNARVDGDFFIIESNPQIFLSDTNHNSDFSINLNSGLFKITDTTNTADVLTIDSSSQVGINKTDPSAALHAYATTGIISESPSNAGITIRRNDNVQYSSLLKYHSGNTEKWVAGLSDAGDFTNSTGNEYFIGTAKTSPVLLINSSSNVGIGTDNPSQKLEVSGNIKATGDVGPYLNLYRSDNIIASGNHLGSIVFGGGPEAYPDSPLDDAAIVLKAQAAGTAAAGDSPSRLIIQGIVDGSASLSDWVTLEDGNATFANNLTVSGADSVVIADYILHDGDGNSKFGFPSNDNFKVRLNGSDVFTMSETTMAFTGDVTVGGNLTVSGTTTTIDTTNLNVEDKNITINYSTGDSSSTADGAGITIQDAVNSSTDATLLWVTSDDRFNFSHGIQLPDDRYLHLGSGNDFIIGHDNTNNRALIKAQQNGQNLEIVQAGDDSDIVFICDSGTGGTTEYLTIDGSAERIDMFKPVFLDANSTNAASPFKAFEIDFDITGSDTVSGDVEQRGISVNTQTTATGGDTSDEHRVVGILSTAKTSVDGDPDDINAFDGVTQLANTSAVTITNARAVQGQTFQSGSAGTCTNSFGGHFQSFVNTAGPTITNMYGVLGTAQLNAAANTTTSFSYGGYFKSDIASSSSGTISSASGVVGEIETDGGTIDNGFGVRSVIDHNGGTLTNAYQFFGATTGTVSGNNFGIQCTSVDFNYLAGSTRLGDTNSSFYNVANCENLRVTKTDDAPNTGGAAVVFDCNMSGSDSMTGDATHVNLRLDTDSTYTGGDTTDEHRINNLLMTLDVSGDSDLIVGVSNQIDVEQSSGTVTTTRGVHNDIDILNTGGAVTTVEGTNNDITISKAETGDISRATASFNHVKASSAYDDTINQAQGVWGQVEIQAGSSTISVADGLRGEVETDSGTVTTASGVKSLIDHNGGTITTARLFYGAYTGTASTKWGILLDEDEYNKLSGFLSVGKDFDITSHIKNTLTVYHDGADNDNGVLIVRDDSTTDDGDLLGAIGFDSADGNVPSSSLEASAYIASYAAELHTTGDKGGHLAFGTAPINQNDDTVSSEHMRITSEGLVGIGVTSPASKVEIQSSGANGLVLGVDSGNATLSSRLFMTNGTGGQGIALINNAGVFQFLTGSTPDSTSGSEKMRLTSGGNLLIGTTTDSGEKLNVSGNTKITGNLTVSGTTAGIVPKIYGNVIKLIPSDFMDNGDGGNTKFGVAYTDVPGTGYGMRPPNNATEIYAFVSIPEGMKATHVDIFDKTNLAIEVFEANINTTTMTSKGTGNCNTTLDITDVNSTATNFLAIEITTTSVDNRIYGGQVTIAAI